jgi:hypothetical protein
MARQNAVYTTKGKVEGQGDENSDAVRRIYCHTLLRLTSRQQGA